MKSETKVCGYEFGPANNRSYLSLFRREFDDGVVYDIDFTRDGWKSIHQITRRNSIQEGLCHFDYYVQELPKSFLSVNPAD